MGTSKDEGGPVEGEDFYREGAYVVFTARYHLRRGYCCESGCRHLCSVNYKCQLRPGVIAGILLRKGLALVD
ncbi:MAG TPA: DUF5522 domain-containing protein [Pyrinomonadaceae bacterium]